AALGRDFPDETEVNRARRAATEVIAAWQDLRRAFEKATRIDNGCLSLGINFGINDLSDEEFSSGNFTVNYTLRHFHAFGILHIRAPISRHPVEDKDPQLEAEESV